MKKFYSLTLSLLFVAIGVQAAPADWKTKISLKENSEERYFITPEQEAAVKKAKAQIQENQTWLPGKLDIYESFDDGATWHVMDNYKFTYENGLCVVEEYNGGRALIKYDNHGNWIERITQIAVTDGSGNVVDWENSEKNIREYDNIVPSFQTLRQDLAWNSQTGTWEQYYKHQKLVTRNKYNKVDAVIVRSFLNETQYADIEGFRVMYDFYQPTVVTAIIEYSYDYDQGAMSSGLTYQNFVWEECGQIMSIDYLCLGDVRAKSYDIVMSNKVVATAEVTYNTDGLFSCTKVTKDAEYDYYETYSYAEKDNYGSYEESIVVTENGTIIGGDKLNELYDQYGTQLDYHYESYIDGEWALYDRIVSTPAYDGAKLIEMVIQMTNPDTMQLETTQKYIYGDYFEAGVANVTQNDVKVTYNCDSKTIIIAADAPVAYGIYSVDGRRVATGVANQVSVDHLTPGIYILKASGAETLKFAK